MTLGRVSRGTVLQFTRYGRAGAGFETGDFVEEMLGGGLPYDDSNLQWKGKLRCIKEKMPRCPSFCP